MNRSALPWIFVVLALLGWQVGGSSPREKPNPPSAAVPAPPPAEEPSPLGTTGIGPNTVLSPEIGRLLAAYFGSRTVPATTSDLRTIVEDAKYQPPDPYVALVADPLDSFLPARFDQALAAIQEGFADSGFLLDRIDLPWTAEEAKKADPAYRWRPGLLLFRRPGRAGNGRLAIVLLVGETAKQGVHKRAFAQALEAAEALTTERKRADGQSLRRIRILGPTFSGSRESLRLAFEAWKTGFGEKASPEVWLVSGSATSSWLDLCVFDCSKDIRFFRTVVDDDTLLLEGQEYLVEKLGWDPRRIAMLTEADTGYGQGAATARTGGSAKAPMVLRFSSGLSGLRKASEEAERDRTENAKAPRPGPSTLAISLAEESRPVDVVPEFSRVTTPTKDLAISNLLAVLCSEGRSYLGLIATDTRDQIFLAERVREICPDTQLFLLDSDLLLAHPQHRDALDGSIVLSSSALFTRGLKRLEPPNEFLSSGVRQFQSELHEGVVRAIDILLADAEKPAVEGPTRLEPAHPWVSAIGNGSIWPLARLKLPPETTNAPRSAGAKGNALTFTCLVVLVVLSVVLVKVARPLREIPDLPPDLGDRFPLLLALSAILLAWGTLQVVGGLPLWAFGRSWDQLTAVTKTAFWFGALVALLGLTSFFLHDRLRVRALPRLGTSLRWIAIVCLAVAAGALLAWPLLHAWMPGGVEMFHFRARKFTGGLSPLVSLCWLGGGYFLWSILEMKRRTLVVLRGADFPLGELPDEDPILPGCRRIARSIGHRMLHTFPTWRFFAVVAPPALLAVAYLFLYAQPVAEARSYGQVFLGMAIGLFVLALVSFHRFLRLWAELSGLLDRIETLRLDGTFKKLKPEVEWRPMKSFAWSIPAFKMGELSIAKLAAIEEISSDPVALRRLLAQAFEGQRTGDPRTEAEGRRALHAQFAAALGQAHGWISPGPLQDFVAVRLITYIRTVFAHLRNSLLGALVPGFLLLLSITTYEIHPKRVLFLAIWSGLAAAVLTTLWTFVHMERNPTLSAIGGTNAGEVQLNRSFVQTMLSYGVLPLLGLVATRFPQIERLLSGYLNPLMRFVNGAGG